jgi:hypothetical protein
VWPSKISIAVSTCLIRSLAIKYASWFFPALEMIWASLYSNEY